MEKKQKHVVHGSAIVHDHKGAVQCGAAPNNADQNTNMSMIHDSNMGSKIRMHMSCLNSFGNTH